jgi:ABC-type transport system substrate-binding protein
LYNYDAFLFDFNPEDGLDFLNVIKETIESDGKYPVKISKGVNYHDMQDITEKFND